MRRVLLALAAALTLAALARPASPAHILDLIYRGATADSQPHPPGQREEEDAAAEQQPPGAAEEAERACECSGAECVCCVDFNMTIIDLGAGCVRMRYLSPREGVLLNVSYGDSLLRSGVARGPRPAATCVAMIGQLAAVCARFDALEPRAGAGGGLQGCLQLEPKLLGDVQTRLGVGCFAMDDAGGMRLDDGVQRRRQQQQEAAAPAADAGGSSGPESSSSDGGGGDGSVNEDEILAAVNESAQKGLALFQNWLGLSFGAGGGAQENGAAAAAAAASRSRNNNNDDVASET